MACARAPVTFCPAKFAPPPPVPCFHASAHGRTPQSKAQANWFPTLVSTLGLASGRNVVPGAIILVGPIVIAEGYTAIIGLRAQLFISDCERFRDTAHRWQQVHHTALQMLLARHEVQITRPISTHVRASYLRVCLDHGLLVDCGLQHNSRQK